MYCRDVQGLCRCPDARRCDSQDCETCGSKMCSDIRYPGPEQEQSAENEEALTINLKPQTSAAPRRTQRPTEGAYQGQSPCQSS